MIYEAFKLNRYEEYYLSNKKEGKNIITKNIKQLINYDYISMKIKKFLCFAK